MLLPPMPRRQPRLKGIAEKVERDVGMAIAPIGILAVDDPRLGGVENQPT